MNETRYTLDMENGQYVALAHTELDLMRKVTTSSDLKTLMERCSDEGLKLHSLTDAAAKELHYWLTVVRPAEEYLRSAFPEHTNLDLSRGPKIFQDWRIDPCDKRGSTER